VRIHLKSRIFFDPGIVTRSLGALGLWVKPWENKKQVLYPEIGRFESATFNPKLWRGSYANPAFEKMTSQDAFWAAKIVTSFTDDDIKTIAETGSFTTPGALDHLVKTLIARRDKIGKTWMNLKKINPLDRFEVLPRQDGEKNLRFRDVPVTRGYAKRENTLYRYRLAGNKWMRTKDSRIPMDNAPPKIKIKTSRNNGKTWSKSLTVKLNSRAEIIKIKR